MSWFLILGIVIAIVLVVGIARMRRAAPAVTIDDIPAVFEALMTEPADGHFAVFLFAAAGVPPPPTDSLNVQISIFKGVAGIDWVLTSPLNRDAQSRFVAFFEPHGRRALRLESNTVEYFRVEGDRIAELVQELLREEFGVTPAQRLDLIAEGFTWTGSSATLPSGSSRT